MNDSSQNFRFIAASRENLGDFSTSPVAVLEILNHRNVSFQALIRVWFVLFFLYSGCLWYDFLNEHFIIENYNHTVFLGNIVYYMFPTIKKQRSSSKTDHWQWNISLTERWHSTIEFTTKHNNKNNNNGNMNWLPTQFHELWLYTFPTL